MKLIPVVLLISGFAQLANGSQTIEKPVSSHAAVQQSFHPNALTVLPQDGRDIYFEAFRAARRQIRIEICVLEDPEILQHLKLAIARGVRVRAIVDRGKYEALASEQTNLARYLISAGGELHLSNPIFPRSFPKVILVDRRYVLIGSACLDTETFQKYRDYAYVENTPGVIRNLSQLFENDWRYSAFPGQATPAFNPTAPISHPKLIVAPVNASHLLVNLIQKSRKTLDVTSELLGNPTLESELAAAVARGVRVRLMAPEFVNGATPDIQQLQELSLARLKEAGVAVHVTGPVESADLPYMHARTALFDGKRAYLGSISLSENSATANREVGIVVTQRSAVRKLKAQFKIDFESKSRSY